MKTMPGRRLAALARTVPLVACLGLLPAMHAERAALHVALANGFDLMCDHRTDDGDKTRLYLTSANDDSFVEVTTAEIVSVESVSVPDPAPASVATLPIAQHAAVARSVKLTPADLHEILSAAGTVRNLDVDLLACVVHAESGGRTHAVSRTGAQGLMQLMPHTAAELGVKDSFQPDQNVNGGSAYLNALLVRYHDDLALALAAYNAGPKAVDRYHGVPPYRETRAYVARIIHEFNQRKLAEQRQQTERASAPMPGTPVAHGLQSE